MIPAATTSPPARTNLVDSTSDRLADHVRSEFSSETQNDVESWLPSERELATRFGVSRPVIREATKRLELQGLLDIQHGRGIKVVHQLHRPLTQSLQFDIPDELERLRQLNEMRRIIEPEAARLAALRADAEAIDALQKCHSELEASSSLEEAAKIDAQFHVLIAHAADNRILALVLSSLGDLAEESRRRTLSTTGLDKAIDHHAQILAAIEAHDENKAFRWMKRHVEEASRDLDESAAK